MDITDELKQELRKFCNYVADQIEEDIQKIRITYNESGELFTKLNLMAIISDMGSTAKWLKEFPFEKDEK